MGRFLSPSPPFGSAVIIWRLGLAVALLCLPWVPSAKANQGNESSSSPNCFSWADETTWRTQALVHNPMAASIALDVAALGPDVIECLVRQGKSDSVSSPRYLVHLYLHSGLLGNNEGDQPPIQLQTSNVSVHDLQSAGESNHTLDLFEMVFWPGSYELHFCPPSSGEVEELCIQIGTALQIEDAEYTLAECDSNETSNDTSTPSARWDSDANVTFRLQFEPCLPASITALSATIRVKTSHSWDCQDNGTLVLTRRQHPVSRDNRTDALLEFTMPGDLVMDRFYCIEASLNRHPLCTNLSRGQETPPMCQMQSHIIYLESQPFIAQFIPFCTSHLRCGWLYIAIFAVVLLSISCLLAVCCLYCCCRCCGRRKASKKFADHHHRRDETIPFEGLCLNDPSGGHYPPKKTWVELHEEWDRQPPKNPGKILLLYSPDTKLFKDLQKSLRSFLEEACHCVVLDFFDEELFQTIAFDPELWLTNLLLDPDFKIVVICSEGAYKRQQSLIKGEVLNIPSNTTLDGLFSAGIKFIQDKHAYDYNRLALARYEMLSLSGPEFRLQEMVPNREFLVPTQLHDLFCWIHGYDPLDLLGKPWARYHLELQLLQDDLKAVRKDGRPMAYQ